MTTTTPVLSFRALQLANEQRNAYGLRYHDYARYRKHCANRTHRLRSTLKMTHGKGREFKKLPPITPESARDGHLELLLFEAERAWAYSQDLNNQALLPANRDQASTLRHKATGRFRRAVHWCNELLSLCKALHVSSKLSAESLVEIFVYTLILNGRFLRYRDEFEEALGQLCVASDLLNHLTASAMTSRDQALAGLFSDEISPEIRYCAHELGDSKAYDVDKIVQDVSSKQRETSVEGCATLLKKLEENAAAEKGDGKKRLEEILWEGEPVPVRSPELVDALLKVQEAESRLTRTTKFSQEDGKRQTALGSKKGVAAYDAILSSLSDAEEVARKLAESKQSSTASAGARHIHFVHAYIVYQLLSRRIQRDLLLVEALLGSQEQSRKQQTGPPRKEALDVRVYPALIKLLDSVLQSLEQMRTLSVVDDSPDLASAVEARISYTKARRCFYLSQSYISVKKYPEAISLCQHASLYIRETKSTLSMIGSDPVTFYTLAIGVVEKYEKAISDHSLQGKQAWFAYNGGTVDGDPKSYKKPTFYNIAFNYVQSDLITRLEERAGKQPSIVPSTSAAPQEKLVVETSNVDEEEDTQPRVEGAPRGGLSSLLGGWWGKR